MKRFSKMLMIVLCLMLLSGCGAAKLSDNYSEEKLKEKAEEVIKNLDSEKFDAVEAIMDDNLKKHVPADKLKEVWTNFEKLGKYESISKIVFQEKDGYAVVVVIAKFEKGKIQFTQSYNKDMKLVGIYLK